MRDSLPRQTAILEELFTKPVTVSFVEPDLTSNGGALLLKQLDEGLGLTELLAMCINDDRDPERTQHDVLSLIRQRFFGVCCGYEDANDVARYNNDTMQKVLCDAEPSATESLASQPTLSRFENQVDSVDLYRMGAALFDLVVERHRKRLGKRAKVVTIDVDATVNFAHGEQQLSLFNGFYDGRCFLPLMAFLSFNDEPEQYVATTILRSGTAGNDGVLGTLRRLIDRTRAAFPRAQIIVRLDSGFSGPEVLNLLDAKRVQYLVGFAGNSVLSIYSAYALYRARLGFERSGETEPFYGSTREYSAKTWGKRRRVLYKAEVLHHIGREAKDNIRYVVTNMTGRAEDLYRQYVGRCDSENRIKEAKIGLSSDRVSCVRFNANQFRVLLATAALVLFQELRLRATRTPAARWQVDRLRQCLIQIAGRVTSSARRLLVRLPRHHPWADLWLNLARACAR